MTDSRNETKRRVWWVFDTGFHDGYGNTEAILFEHPDDGNNHERLVHVTELQPGDVILSADEFAQVYDALDTAHGSCCAHEEAFEALKILDERKSR